MFKKKAKKSVEIITDEKRIDEILSRSVKEILPTKEKLKDALMSGERLKFYIGTDATGTSLHLGHATNYLILEDLRALGHEVIFLIGDFTSRIGDPTDKTAARVQQTREDVVSNVKTWIDQIRPIVNLDDPKNPIVIKYNHDWLASLNFEDVVNLASHFTVQQMLERDMFDKRLRENKPIYLHEFFYPLMQGYDSVAMDVDVELCGSDQKFNALAGRTLQRKMNNKEKFVFITTLLENPKTGKKMMSKSEGTGVFLDVSPQDMYGGIMSQPDENMRQLFVDTTRLSFERIEEILSGSNPRDNKMILAHTIVSMYHGKDIADKAQEAFVTQFQKQEIPEDLPEVVINEELGIVEVLKKTGLAKSNNEAKRKIQEGAVVLDGNKIKSISFKMSGGKPQKGDTVILKLGRKIIKLKFK